MRKKTLKLYKIGGGASSKFFFSRTSEPNLTCFRTNHPHGKKNVICKIQSKLFGQMWDNYGIGKINGEGSDNMETEEGLFKKKLSSQKITLLQFFKIFNACFDPMRIYIVQIRKHIFVEENIKHVVFLSVRFDIPSKTGFFVWSSHF